MSDDNVTREALREYDELIGNPLDIDNEVWEPPYSLGIIDYYAGPWNEWPDFDGTLIAVGSKGLCLTPPVIPQPDEEQ